MKEQELLCDLDLIEDFVDETVKNIRLAREALFQLEQGDQPSQAAEALLRPIHNIKGSSSFLRLQFIQDFTHDIESTLDLLMDGKIRTNSRLLKCLAKAIDHVEWQLKAVEEASLGNRRVVLNDAASQLLEELENAVKASDELGPLDPSDTLPGPSGQQLASGYVKVPKQAYNGLLKRLNGLRETGELVLADQEFLEHLEEEQRVRLERLRRGLEEIVTTLRDFGRKNLSTLYAFLKSAAQDVADQEGKEIDFEMLGEDISMDTEVLHKLREPLMHLVRNAVYHGLETPKERAALSKDEEGKVLVEVVKQPQGHQIVVRDDGKGLNLHKIRERMRETGQAVPNTAKELCQAVFLPGFSTAGKANVLAGRGIGLDIVKKALEDIGGTVRVESQAGAGSSFFLSLP